MTETKRIIDLQQSKDITSSLNHLLGAVEMLCEQLGVDYSRTPKSNITLTPEQYRALSMYHRLSGMVMYAVTLDNPSLRPGILPGRFDEKMVAALEEDHTRNPNLPLCYQMAEEIVGAKFMRTESQEGSENG